VIAINGARQPAADTPPKTFRQAFIYIVSNGRSLDQTQVTKLDRIRTQWQSFFGTATEGKMTSITQLR
jgi:hypothetical protein